MTLTEKIRELCKAGYTVSFSPSEDTVIHGFDLRIRLIHTDEIGLYRKVDTHLLNAMLDGTYIGPENVLVMELNKAAKKLKAASR